jgi:hypothetical protein
MSHQKKEITNVRVGWMAQARRFDDILVMGISL